MRGLALLGLVLAAPALAAAPEVADWRLLGLAQDGESAFVIDQSSVRDRRDGKQARVAVINDEQSEIGAIEMTLVIDCAARRERALSFNMHDRLGRVFPQGTSKRFEPINGERPWYKHLCPGAEAKVALAPLGREFPMVAMRKLLDDRASQATKPPEQVK